MKQNYSIMASIPLTLWIEVSAENEQEALEKAKELMLHTPLKKFRCFPDTCRYVII